jgi:hypothetical protein
MSYQSLSFPVADVQLKVQELVCQLQDNSVVSTSGNTATINVGAPISEVRCALFVDDSAGTSAPVVASDRTVSGNQVTLNLGAALADADCIILEYVISE